MPDVITLLPDSVANQIAAGEVIQRPASIVKELVENAVDAGSSRIKVLIKDAGKTLVQVIDDGCGMSETDARLAFERHATSKIKTAEDLFAITTKGFRGEALASIAAVSQTELKTCRTGEELGTHLSLRGSKLEKQEPVSCPEGSNFAVRNLFFNIPARRKFLKSDQTELKHIITEFQRIALTHPATAFSLYHNEVEIYHIEPGPLKQRILSVFGKNYNQHLVNIQSNTSIVGVKGFIGKPDIAKKKYGEQFFFINNRFMKHPYLHRAVMDAYEHLLPQGTLPSYFVFLEADPSTVDVNIHPTKTEIKFEDERSIWQIIHATIREGLGKFNIGPTIDFDREGMVDIPASPSGRHLPPPDIPLDPTFNPFENPSGGMEPEPSSRRFDTPAAGWEKLYSGLGRQDTGDLLPEGADASGGGDSGFLQVRNKYIVCPVKSGLMVIDQRRAHQRILFENYLQRLQQQSGTSQKCLYPEDLQLEPGKLALLKELMPDLSGLGFELETKKQGHFLIRGLPAFLPHSRPGRLLEEILEEYEHTEKEPGLSGKEKVALSMASASAVPYGKKLQAEEMQEMIDQLFACSMPNYTVHGKAIVSIITLDELDQRFSGLTK